MNRVALLACGPNQNAPSAAQVSKTKDWFMAMVPKGVSPRKGDPEKVQMASHLRAHTMVTLNWIAQRLKMGVWTYPPNCLVQNRKMAKCQ